VIAAVQPLADPVQLDLPALLRLVTERTMRYDFTVWQWGDAIAIDGLLDAADLLGDPAPRERVLSFYRRWAARDLDWRDHLTPGLGLLRVAGDPGDPELLSAARRLANWLADAPRTADGLALYRPDIGTVRHSCWVDTIYHEPPFLAALARATGQAKHEQEALRVWQTHTDALSHSGRPFLAHSYDAAAGLLRGYGWGRGNAWALFGMVDTLELLPSDVPGRAEAERDFRRLAETIAAAQDPSGFWRTLLDDREAYLETSTTAMFGAAFTKANRLGLLDDTWLEPAERAWRATRSRIDALGQLYGVSAWTHASIHREDDLGVYRTLPTEVNWWGQGAALRAIAERLRAGMAA
jgi:unsaturated rhamnogalacturonyl hydrolase